jgi:hypothetical protein
LLPEIGALAVTNRGGNPIELHLLFVPCEFDGASRYTVAPQEPESQRGKKTLPSHKDRRTVGQSIIKRLATQSGLFGPIARSSFSEQLDRGGLRTAWKYVYLLRGARRLTRYVE